MLNKILRTIESFIPKPVFRFFQPAYHFLLAFLSAAWYGFPSHHLTIVEVTGTKGKSSAVEITAAILRAHGFKTASASTIRFVIDGDAQHGGFREQPNLYKMTVPGRFFLNRFLARALQAGCTHVVLEMSSEAARQYRNRFIYANGFIFTNLAPEHIESHGSFEAYAESKASIARSIAEMARENPYHPQPALFILNANDKESVRFERAVEEVAALNTKIIHFDAASLRPETHENGSGKLSFSVDGRTIQTELRGMFNAENVAAAWTYAKAIGCTADDLARALSGLTVIHGRVEMIQTDPFEVVVDYAHTKESLEALYAAFPHRHAICVLGNTGGGRDTWKRGHMARAAANYCSHIILTNEDPYDDDPMSIINDMHKEISGGTVPVEIILDRREAIAHALEKASKWGAGSFEVGDREAQGKIEKATVLITGKGTDPYIMGPAGSKIPWSDARVAREELEKIRNNR